MPRLIVKRGAKLLENIQIDEEKQIFAIGSDPDNEYVIKDETVSPKHVELQKIDGEHYIIDMGGESGTRLNGLPLNHEQQIVDGDEFSIADISFSFQTTPNGGQYVDFKNDDFGEFVEDLIDTSGQKQSLEPDKDGVGEISISDAAHEEEITSPTFEFHELENATGEFPAPERDEPQDDVEKSYYLQAIYGPNLGKRYPLKFGETKIGRDNTLNDIVIRYNEKGALDPSISRRHATIAYRDGTFYVTDKRSKTRTYVNQQKLDPASDAAIYEGDEIEIVSDQKSTILRMSSDSNLNLAPPKKAGVWWLRNQLRVGFWLSAALGLMTLSAFGLAYLSRHEINKKPEQLTFVEEPWLQLPKSDREINAVTTERSAIDRNQSLALADLDGDNDVDAIYTDASGRLNAVDGTTKKALWQADNLQVLANIPVVLSDLNANGLQDVIVTGADTRLRALDGATGAEIWMGPILGARISGPPGVTDLDGDGLKDIVICTSDGQIHLAYNQINQINWVTIESGKSILSTPSSGDWDGDGFPEVFVGTEDGKALIIDGRFAKIEKMADFAEAFGATDDNSNFRIRYPIAAAHINNDKLADLVIGSTGGTYVALDGKSLNAIWSDRLVSKRTHYDQDLGAAVGDCDGDQIPDIVIVSNQMIRVLKGSIAGEHSKASLWDFEAQGDLFSTPVTLADFNKDGAHDIVIGTRKGSVYILNGKTGEVFSEIKNEWNAISSPLLAADLTGNGFLDVAYRREDQSIYVIQSNSIIMENSVVWGQSHGDESHLGKYAYVGPSSKLYDIMTSASGLLFLMVALVTVSARQRRFRTIHRNQATV